MQKKFYTLFSTILLLTLLFSSNVHAQDINEITYLGSWSGLEYISSGETSGTEGSVSLYGQTVTKSLRIQADKLASHICRITLLNDQSLDPVDRVYGTIRLEKGNAVVGNHRIDMRQLPFGLGQSEIFYTIASKDFDNVVYNLTVVEDGIPSLNHGVLTPRKVY